MRLFRVALFGAVAAASVLFAAPAGAQQQGELPDLPGMDRVRDAVRGQIAQRLGPAVARAFDEAIADAEAARRLLPGPEGVPTPDDLRAAVASPNPAAAPDSTRPRARDGGSGGRSLPRTGAPVIGLALLGVALVSGGRMLVELTRGSGRARGLPAG